MKNIRDALFDSVLVILLTTCLIAPNAAAQGDCTTDLQRADNFFRAAKYDSALFFARFCLENKNPDESQEKSALMLKAKIYLAKSDNRLAEKACRELLEKYPDFEPNPIVETPELIAFFNKVRDTVRKERVAKRKPLEKKSTKKKRWPWIVAGGLIPVLAISYFLFY